MNQISLKQGMPTVDDMQIKSPTELDMTPILHKPYTYSVHNEAQLTVVSKVSDHPIQLLAMSPVQISCKRYVKGLQNRVSISRVWCSFLLSLHHKFVSLWSQVETYSYCT